MVLNKIEVLTARIHTRITKKIHRLRCYNCRKLLRIGEHVVVNRGHNHKYRCLPCAKRLNIII